MSAPPAARFCVSTLEAVLIMEKGEAAPAAAEAQQAAQQAAQTAAAAAPAVGFAKRKNRGTLRKRAADSDDDGGGDGAGGGVQRKAAKAKEGSMAFTTKRTDREQVFAFESSNAVQQARDGGATRTNEQETAFDRDARSVLVAAVLYAMLAVLCCSAVHLEPDIASTFSSALTHSKQSA